MPKHQLWNPDAPIIRRADENDVYKILMMYLIWKYYPNLRVQFGFKNRTKTVYLPKYVDLLELQEHLRETAKLQFTDEIIAVYRSWGMFPEEFLQALKGIKFCAPTVYKENKQLRIDITGPWFDVTLWEIYILCITSELYGRARARDDEITEADLWKQGDMLLSEKIELFNAYPDLRIAQFGLRRRFSALWEDHVTERLLNECPGIITGVSNMYLADKFGVEAQGTNAHELPMALAALARHEGPEAMRGAPYKVLELWQRLFGHKSLIMLDDAYGSEIFRASLPREFILNYRGFRHDSGDPIKYGEDVIAFYKHHGVDPNGKIIIFSDGLNPKKAIQILEHFKGRILVAFGMGTNLTNDMGLIHALSLVMKITKAAGNPAVKLSNNLAKATGPESEVDYVKAVFGYTNVESQALEY